MKLLLNYSSKSHGYMKEEEGVRALLLYLGGEMVRDIYKMRTTISNRSKMCPFKFHSTKINQWESALTYITRLRKLSKTCQFDQYTQKTL